MKEAILAIDLGTSATKLLLVDRAGTILGRQRTAHHTFAHRDGEAEQHPDEWWTHIRTAASMILDAQSEGVSVAAISVTGQMHGLVVHDSTGRPAHPAIIWQDHRSAATLPALLAQLPERHPARSANPIATGYQAAKWHFLAERRPDITEAARGVLLPKDEIIFRLTGSHVTDPSDAVGSGWYDTSTNRWDSEVCAVAGISADALPEVLSAGSVAGHLTAQAASEIGLDSGIPVVIAGGDAAVAAFGAGATDAVMPLLLLSTGTQTLQPSWTCEHSSVWPSANPAGLSPWLRVAATINGGNVITWARTIFGEPPVTPGPYRDELVFLPYLRGERCAELDSGAAGSFIGLREHHDRGDLAAAVLDGVALSTADAFERIEGRIGTEAPVLVGGGGVRNDAWLTAVASAFGRPLSVMNEPDLSAWGAARSAATTLHWIDPVRDHDIWLPKSTKLLPDPHDVQRATSRLTKFQELAHRVYGLSP